MIACYIRVSTTSQNSEGQKKDVRRWLKGQATLSSGGRFSPGIRICFNFQSTHFSVSSVAFCSKCALVLNRSKQRERSSKRAIVYGTATESTSASRFWISLLPTKLLIGQTDLSHDYERIDPSTMRF